MPLLTRNDGDGALYEQLIQHLRSQILEGSLPAGMRLPSESQLIEDFGVSRGTVRQALSVLADEGLIERIHGSGTYVKARSESGSQPSHNHNGSRNIGLVLCHSNHQLNMEIMVGVERGVKSRGYQLVVTYAEGNTEQQRHNILRLLDNHVAGLIIFPVGDSAEQEGLLQAQAANVPFVLVDRYYADVDSDWVVADNRSGGYRATEHLLVLGHRRIGFVYASEASSLRITSIGDRWQGYRRALASYGLPYNERLVFQCPTNATENFNYDPLLTMPDRPTAVFAINDYEALTVMKAAQRCGLRVPQDLAVVGFDDLSFSPYLMPALTTVTQPFIDMGFRAVNILMDRLDGLYMPRQHIVLPTNLVIRESCGVRLRVQESIESVV
jgi:GntR family transcriptional regulator, arabinose operon transcriptional repressor